MSVFFPPFVELLVCKTSTIEFVEDLGSMLRSQNFHIREKASYPGFCLKINVDEIGMLL